LVVELLELALELREVELLLSLERAIVVVVVALVDFEVLALVVFVDLVVDIVDLPGAFVRRRLRREVVGLVSISQKRSCRGLVIT
jgi:hypothetical protein